MLANGSSTHLQRLLDLLQAGDATAREALVQHSVERFRCLASRMFRHERNLRTLDETDDVLQQALLRLYRALAQVHPPTVRAYVGLAARQVRFVLRDLARKYAAAKVVSFQPVPRSKEPEDLGGEPSDLLEWGEFHETVERLPEEERETFDLLLYEGLSQAEAADLLGISIRSVKRRWQRARLLLRDALRGQWPETDDR